MTAIPLSERTDVSIPDAGRLMGRSRQRILELIELGEIQAFTEGKRRRVVVASIREYISRKTEAEKKAVGLAA